MPNKETEPFEMPSPPPPPAVAVCILGMHRGGASAAAGLLHLLGVDLGRRAAAEGDEAPAELGEHRQIVNWHINLLKALGSCSEDFLPLPERWDRQPAVAPFRQYMLAFLQAEFAGRPLWGFKDPRTCRTLQLWHSLFNELGVRGQFVVVLRNPDEVAISMSARSACPYNQSLLLWLAHMLEAERGTRGSPRALVSYDRLLADWRSEAERLGTDLAIQWPLDPRSVSDQAPGLPDANLRRHRAMDSMTAEQAITLNSADAKLAGWAFELYRLLAAATEGGKLDSAAVDQICDEFHRAAGTLAGWRPLRLPAEKGFKG